MVNLAVRDNPRFSASDIEMRRRGPSYTIDTLAEFCASASTPARAITSSSAPTACATFATWHRARDLVTTYDFIVVGRPAPPARTGVRLAEALGPECAEKLRCGFLETAVFNISATDLRARVKAGRSIRYLVPDSVERYILRKGLYR